MGPLSRIGTLAAWILSVFHGVAESNFDPERSVSGHDSIGALWWAVPDNGATINQYYAAGYIYGENIGWISLGGIPTDKFQYRNNSPTDFGVNVTPSGALRGYAYGANVGWIHFEPVGNPRVDWTSGKLAGRAWSGNLGWIELESASQFLRLQSLPEPDDADGDGIADAWEISHASNLTSLSAENDADADGSTDLAEFLAGTRPLDFGDRLALQVSVSSTPRGSKLTFPTKSGYVYVVDQRPILGSSAEWTRASEKIIGSGSEADLTLPFANSYSFYRVRVFPPLSELPAP